MNGSDARDFLHGMFNAALGAVGAATCVPPHLPAPPPTGRTLVIGAGKAAAAMARSVEQHWPGELSGLVVTRYGHGVPCERIEVVVAAHPVPDQAGKEAAERMLAMVSHLNEDDLVLCLISGGGSALLTLPAPGITLEQKQQINRALLKCGATITEINCVRKHLSSIKGGRLALACAPARVVSLLISDVAGDDPATIASGPTLADASTCAEALAVLHKYGVALPDGVRQHLLDGRGETPKPCMAGFERNSVHLIARAQDALEAAAAYARARGITPYILSDRMEGEARALARSHAALARQVVQRGQPFAAPCVILSGGETTVTVRGGGRGGRNAEFLLALALALDGQEGVHALACDTDGIDGTEDNAGAVCGPDTLARAAALGIDGGARLDDNDGYGFFAALNDLVLTGPTRTNVNDFRALLVL